MQPRGAGSSPAPAESPDLSDVRALLHDACSVATTLGREDIAARLLEASARVDRTDTILCVVGEFKQGKSALINALIGVDVCPVDDDLATMAVTVVRHGAATSATVQRKTDDGSVVETIPPDTVPDWVTERANPDNRRNVELVEIALPNPFLESGLTLVDTPGVGGLNAAHAAATLAFLPSADALVFVTDASAELTADELDFLSRARHAGPPILIGFTKIDIYPAWRRILAIDERRLAEAGLNVPTFPLSATLRARALRNGAADAPVDLESGYPTLAEALTGEVVERTHLEAAGHAIRELATALDQLREPLAAELAAVENPEAANRIEVDLNTVRTRLADLADAGSQWSVRLDDEFAALRTAAQFTFKREMRQILRETHDEIERVDPAKAWPEMSKRLQARVAGVVRAAFMEATDGAARIQAAVTQLLADEDAALATTGEPWGFDVESMWTGGTFSGTMRTGLIASFGLLAGATAGVEMLGVLGALLGTALVGPVLLGAALFFGGKEVVDQRRQALNGRRQEARTFVGQFIDNVTFEVDGRHASLIRELQRQLRAHFAARIAELTRTATDTAAALERARRQATGERETRLTELHLKLDEVADLSTRATRLGMVAEA